ncbi:hypothetical protein [Streptomyces sp. NPDC047009]|uniref:hypothetical protein n=1 Tax=Streptomyces sp. NPDC047009 TaxID=3154496 RepID=UPI0033ED4259
MTLTVIFWPLAAFTSAWVDLVALVNFSSAKFSGGHIEFVGATFSGGTVNFDRATSSSGTIEFVEATFSSGTVRFGGRR